MSQNLWLALARKYLADYEISISYREKNQKVMKNLIKKAIASFIDKKLMYYNEKNPPVLKEYDSEFIIYDRKAKIIETETIKYAKLVVRQNGFDIYIAKNDEKNRKRSLTSKRTLLAHELGHTYLYDIDAIPPKPLIGNTDFTALILSKVNYGPEEGLPYDFGRELLIPTFLLEKHIAKCASLKLFFQACRKFMVTRQIMAKRLYWSMYDYESGKNYWKDSILITFPLAKLRNQEYPTSISPNEIYKGKHFKNFDIKSRWEIITKLINNCKNEPNEVITTDTPFVFKSIELIAEGIYERRSLSNDGNLYILIRPKRKEDFQQLKLIEK